MHDTLPATYANHLLILLLEVIDPFLLIRYRLLPLAYLLLVTLEVCSTIRETPMEGKS